MKVSCYVRLFKRVALPSQAADKKVWHAGPHVQDGDLAHAELHGKVAKLVLEPAFAIADLANRVGPR